MEPQTLPPDVEREMRLASFVDSLDRELTEVIARNRMIPRPGEIWADRINPNERIVIIAVQDDTVFYMPPHNHRVLRFRVDTCQDLYEFAGEC